MQQKPPRWNVSPALIAPEAQPLWRGLAFIAPLWGHVGKGVLLGADARPMSVNPVANNTLWRGSPYGIALGSSSAADMRRLLKTAFAPVISSDGAGGGDFTLMVLCNPTSSGSVAAAFRQRLSTGNLNLAGLDFNSNGAGGASAGSFAFTTYNTAWSSVAAAGAVDGKWHVWAGVRRAATMMAFRDGVAVASAAPALRNIYSASADFCIGGTPQAASTGLPITDDIGVTAAWNRALSDAEIRMLARDPFCMFRPQAEWRGVWTPLAGGDIVLNPADLMDIFGYETPAFSQAHYLSAADAAFGENWETPAFAQAHLFAPHEMNFALPFDLASLAMNSQGAPGFRVRSISADARSQNTGADARTGAVPGDSRSRSITE